MPGAANAWLAAQPLARTLPPCPGELELPQAASTTAISNTGARFIKIVRKVVVALRTSGSECQRRHADRRGQHRCPDDFLLHALPPIARPKPNLRRLQSREL